MGTVYWIGIQIQCSMQTHCSKKTFNLILIEKVLNCRGQLGLQCMSPSKEWANVFERAVVTNDIFWFTLPANCTRKANMKRKYVNTDNAQWKEPELPVKWVVAQTCKACKLAFYNIKRSRRLGFIPSAGIATADTWFKCFLHRLLPANTCWCWLTCQHSAFHRPTRFEWVSGN